MDFFVGEQVCRNLKEVRSSYKEELQYCKKPSASHHLERTVTGKTFTGEVLFASCYMTTFIILKVMFLFLLYFLNTYSNLFQFIRMARGILFPNEVLPMNMLAATCPLTKALSDCTSNHWGFWGGFTGLMNEVVSVNRCVWECVILFTALLINMVHVQR